MPTLTECCASDPDILQAEREYDAADAALVEFNREHPLRDYKFLDAKAQGWRKSHLDALTLTFDKARARLTELLNQAANARYGAPTAKHEVNNPRLKPNWLEDVATQ